MATGITIPAKDKYDLAVEYLRQHPEKIEDVWLEPHDHMAGCLFQFAQKDPYETIKEAGCLTMIRLYSCHKVPSRSDLTEEIKADTRIPTYVGEITSDNLPVFAEWQRRLDVELKRNDPVSAEVVELQNA